MDSMKIGYLPVCDSLPLFVAKDKHFFEMCGLNVTLEPFETGNAVISAMTAGLIDGGVVGSVPLIFARNKGLPITPVFNAGYVKSTSGPYLGLYVWSDSEIKTIHHLNGKRVALNGYNTNSDILLRLATKKAAKLELNCITMPYWAMIDSLEHKLIDCAFLAEPYISTEKSKKLLRFIMSSEEIIPEFQNSFICFLNNQSIQHKHNIDKFKMAYDQAIIIMSNPEQANEYLKENNKQLINADITQQTTLPGWATDIENAISGIEKVLTENGIVERGKIEINDLQVIYEGEKKVPAVEDVSFIVNPGEFVCILGTSGCGKSTILNAIAGFVTPTHGTVILDDSKIEGPGIERGIVFQSHALFPWKTVRENVEFGLKMKGISKQNCDAISKKYLNFVGLTKFGNSYPAELSGGMEQRVGIARVLANDPLVMLMDEPFGALDTQTRQQMQELLLKIWNVFSKTIIFVTHDVDEAIFLADRLLVMTATPGKIKKQIRVNLPRPRNYKMMSSPEFIKIKEEVIELIREEMPLDMMLKDYAFL